MKKVKAEYGYAVVNEQNNTISKIYIPSVYSISTTIEDAIERKNSYSYSKYMKIEKVKISRGGK